MKNTARLFVVVLTLTAAAASTRISAQVQPASLKPTATKASAMPVPTCPPDDPNGCGIGGN